VYRVGLTGGIASGKSTVSRALAGRGATIIDADVVARTLVEPGSPLLDELVTAFGDSVLRDDGTLDRAELGRIAFSSVERLARLNAIVHPPLVARLIALMEEAERETARERSGGVLVVDAALLAEWDVLDLFDVIVVVEASVEARVSRLVANGLPEAEARERIAAQYPPDELVGLADIVVVNDGTLDELRRRADALATRLFMESVEGRWE
jgi:dephospho-CoA kinase